MTTTTTQSGLTVRGFLANGAGNEVAALQNAISQHGVISQAGGELNRLNPEGRRAADETLAAAAASLLDVDLGEVLIYSWRTHDRLVNAARETIRVPGRREVVQLASHEITWTQEPTVDLLVDGALVHTFRFKLTIGFDIEVAAAVVQDGKLTALRAGDSKVTGAFALELPTGDLELLRRERELPLHVIIQLGGGIPLLSNEPPRAAATGETAATIPA